MKKTIVNGLAVLVFASLAVLTPAAATAAPTRTAIFAGGNFWCMEEPFQKIDGVLSVTTGYTGGRVVNPTAEQVNAGGTGHAEAVLVTFDPSRVGYEKLLDTFWRNINPTDDTGQFIDRGDQFRAEIFYADEEQQRLAEASKQALENSWRFKEMFSLGRIVVGMSPAGPFYPADEDNQDFYLKNPLRYRYYRWNSGRDDFLEKYWKKDGK